MKCPNCNVNEGEYHLACCDIETCPVCGGQALQCFSDCSISGVIIAGCENEELSEDDRIKWDGKWSGIAECQEFGWYSKFTQEFGWITCNKDDPDASEDVNRLSRDAHWNRKKQRWVKN